MNIQVLVSDINIGYEDIVNIQVIMASIVRTLLFVGFLHKVSKLTKRLYLIAHVYTHSCAPTVSMDL